MQGKKAAGHHFPKVCCPNATRLDRRPTYGFTSRHAGRGHARLAPRAGSTRRGAALAPGAQASTVPRQLYAERRLLHPAVAQRAAVDRKAWIGTTQPADSEKSLPAHALRDAPWRYPGPAPFGRCAQVTALRDTARWCLTLGMAGPTLRRDIPDSALLIRATCSPRSVARMKFCAPTSFTAAAISSTFAAKCRIHAKCASDSIPDASRSGWCGMCWS